MAAIAGLDTGASLFLDHRDPAVAAQLGGYRLADGIRNVSRERRCAQGRAADARDRHGMHLVGECRGKLVDRCTDLELPRTGGRHAKDGTFGSQPRTFFAQSAPEPAEDQIEDEDQ